MLPTSGNQTTLSLFNWKLLHIFKHRYSGIRVDNDKNVQRNGKKLHQKYNDMTTRTLKTLKQNYKRRPATCPNLQKELAPSQTRKAFSPCVQGRHHIPSSFLWVLKERIRRILILVLLRRYITLEKKSSAFTSCTDLQNRLMWRVLLIFNLEYCAQMCYISYEFSFPCVFIHWQLFSKDNSLWSKQLAKSSHLKNGCFH